ncbi:MAG: hypothetical protein SF052_23800 [Bacteroidia bacterium]|nr:hypothetical protein [Bacteroidia bacterium]
MKSMLFKRVFVALGVLLMFLIACKPDPDQPPPNRIYDLEIEGDSATVFPALGETVTAKINVSVPFGRTVELRIYRQVDSTLEQLYDDSPTPETSNFQYEIIYAVGNPIPKGNGHATHTETAGSDVWLRIEITDDNGLKAERRFHIAVRGGKINDLGEIVLYMLNDNNNGDTLNMLNTQTGMTISPAKALKDILNLGSQIDFGYLYTPIDEVASLASVSTYPTDFLLDPLMPGNITRFRKTTMSIQEFVQLNETDENELLDAYIMGTVIKNSSFKPPESIYKGLKAGDVIAFATDEAKAGGRKIGLIRVADILPGLDGKITLELKVQD